jgi:hypothetical protein
MRCPGVLQELQQLLVVRPREGVTVRREMRLRRQTL